MADAIINGKIQPKRTKAMDMCFHWLRNRKFQQQLCIDWRPEKANYTDYWTKHHPAIHHQKTRRDFLTPMIVLKMLHLDKQQTTRLAAAATYLCPQPPFHNSARV